MSKFLGKFSRTGTDRRSIASSDAVTLVEPQVEPAKQAREDEPEVETELHGLFQLYPLKRAGIVEQISTSLDIIAIHGLNGDPYRTWTDGGHFWLQDFLPSAFPEARIFTYGYNSGVAFTGSASKVDDYARTLLERLRAKRREFDPNVKRPILFICHSLGGIVFKKAMVIAHERSERYSAISKDTYGVMFMGTPHRGSDMAFWGTVFGKMADVLTLGSIRTQLLQDLQLKSTCLGDICTQFLERAQSLRIFTFYERLRIKGMPKLVVDEHSAVMQHPNEVPIPIEADHRSMCRFSTNTSEKYQLVLDCLRELVEDSMEEKQPYDTPARAEFLRSLKRLEPEEILRKLSRPSPGTCTWITETTNFKDWRNLVMHKLLWIWGVPGVGKTTAARYLLENIRRWLQRRGTAILNQSVVAFFFCDSKDWLRNNHHELVCSLLYQILSQNQENFRYLDETDLQDFVSRIKDDPVNSTERGSEYLWKIFHTILQRSKGTSFWIIIDALDELEPDSRTVVLRQMSLAIDQDLGQRIKLLFSDRVSPKARHFSSKALSLEMEARGNVADDVRRFISDQVENLCNEGTIDWRYQTQIEDTLSQLSEGNFLHASLACTNFRSGVQGGA
ncbi:hypothetical protein AOQ84DRAFT_437835 [Glonium stellatum]|uniref:NACHT domain-containing protein n=1 Tax=Glonium stellatum TaxID=574774 RepID=A0A8E2F690_9PEZI|nr:hypothetical protein AOQ84DRAFT_437835 [Glonium stellatum]